MDFSIFVLLKFYWFVEDFLIVVATNSYLIFHFTLIFDFRSAQRENAKKKIIILMYIKEMMCAYMLKIVYKAIL